MINRPFMFLGTFLIKRLFTWFKFPSLFPIVFYPLFGVVNELFVTNGIFPTLRVLWNVRRIIGQPSTALTNLLLRRGLNPYIVSRIIGVLIPHWDSFLKPDVIINFHKAFKWFIYIYIFGAIGPIGRYILRIIFGSLFSCLGIIWSEFNFLKPFQNIAEYYVDCVQYFSGLNLLNKPNDLAVGLSTGPLDETTFTSVPLGQNSNSLPTEGKLYNPTNELLEETKKVNSDWLTYLGIYVLGFIGISLILISADLSYPDNKVTTIPVIHSYLECVYYSANWLFEWWNNLPKGEGGGSGHSVPFTPEQKEKWVNNSAPVYSPIPRKINSFPILAPVNLHDFFGDGSETPKASSSRSLHEVVGEEFSNFN